MWRALRGLGTRGRQTTMDDSEARQEAKKAMTAERRSGHLIRLAAILFCLVVWVLILLLVFVD